ncbi:MAG: hypothetical protein ACLGPM_08960 [Acidobacteriota bacterium]
MRRIDARCMGARLGGFAIAWCQPSALLPLKSRLPARRALHQKQPQEVKVANTKSITDKEERKKVKRAARKKAAPKAERTTPRGSNKKKVRKLVRGQSKR